MTSVRPVPPPRTGGSKSLPAPTRIKTNGDKSALSSSRCLCFSTGSQRDRANRSQNTLVRLAPNDSRLSVRQFIINKEIRQDAPVRHLFVGSRGPLTLQLWMTFFINYLVLIRTLVWTPTLMKQAGMSIAEGSLALTFNNVGGILEIIVAGPVLDRFRSSLFSLSAAFLVDGITSALIGYSAFADEYQMARPKRFELLTPRFVVWAGPLKSLRSVTVLTFPLRIGPV